MSKPAIKKTICRKAVQIDIEEDRGSTFRKTITWKIKDTSVEPPVIEPVDLTGCTAVLEIKPTQASKTILHTITTEDGGITLGGVFGTIDLYIDHATLLSFLWSVAEYTLTITYSDGDKRVFSFGKFILFVGKPT